MLKQLLKKELIKLKYLLFFILAVIFGVSFIYYTNTNYAFSGVEPESQMWYQAIHIGFLPHENLQYVTLFIALTISLAQFLPETVSKKFRIPLHLPISQNATLIFYLLIGTIFIVLLNIIFLAPIYFITAHFYPIELANQSLSSLSMFVVASLGIYGGVSALIIEPILRHKVFLFIIAVSFGYFAFFFLPKLFDGFYFVFIVAFSLSLFSSMFLATYHYKRGEFNLFKTKEYLAQSSFITLCLSTIIIFSFILAPNYKKIFTDTSKAVYIFYSPIIKDFVYQKHFGNHVFEWGNASGKIYTQKEFEQTLPFNYYKDLEIQGKLPIVIDEKVFTKKNIRSSRQSFRISAKTIATAKKTIPLYPLFNTNSKKGVIAFPEEFFKINKNGMIVLDYDHKTNKDLTQKFTKSLTNANFSFPAKFIAGKTTNLKPFDEGYFAQDADKKLFQIKQVDKELVVKNISIPKNIDILHISVFENRLRAFYGVLIDRQNKIYLISYDNYKLIALPTENYNPFKDTLEFFRDPMHEIVRINKGDKINAILLDKNYKKIADYSHVIPKTDNIFIKAFDYIFGFYFDDKSLVINFPKTLYSGVILAILFITFSNTRRKKTPQILSRSILVLFTSIYGFILVLLA